MNKKTGLTSAGVALLAYAIANALAQTPKIIDLINENKSFNYEINDEECVVTGAVKYSVVSSWFLVEVEGEDENNNLRVVTEDGIDVLTQESVTTIYEVDGNFVSLDEHVLNLEPMSKYLIDSEKMDLYTPDDIRNILALIQSNYSWHSVKILKIAY